MSGYFTKMVPLGYEELLLFHDPPSGLKAIIAIHSTALGPALGGTRMFNYPTEEAAVEDVLRLARGMTYKAAAADLGLGGGKAVIIGDPARDKNEQLLRAYGRCVEKLGGRYITSVDMGIDEKDLDCVRLETEHLLGESAAGNPSPYTAFGIWRGMKRCVAEVYGKPGLEGLTVAVQGLGGVGGALCRHLAAEKARLIVTDVDPEKVKRAVELWGAAAVEPGEIYGQECDIFAPCAAGAVVNPKTIPRLKCRIVAGSANNVLLDEESGAALYRRGILYAPDYVINAGGLIFVDCCRLGITDSEEIRGIIARLDERLQAIFKRSREEKKPPEVIADLLAEERIRGGRTV